MSELAAGTGAVKPRPIKTTPVRLALRVLSDEDVARVHAAALAMLGADAAAAKTAAKTAPDSFILAGRVSEQDVAVGGGEIWLAAGDVTSGPADRVRPLSGGDPVPATPADLEAICKVADALPEVAVVAGPPVRSPGESPLGDLVRCLAGTSKHVMTSALKTAAEAEAAVALATAVAGSPSGAPLSLCGDADVLDAALVFARAKLPTGIVLAQDAQTAACCPGEPDLAVALVRHHAGVLAGCAAVQAAAPGAPFLYVADPTIAGLPAAGPSAARFMIAARQLADHVDLPVIVAGLRTGSHEPDWQACTQGAQAAMCTTSSGADLTGGAGTLGAGAAFSLQQLVMDSEIFSWNAFIAAGVTVDDETLALDTIKQVGIGGNYLSQRHTRRHMKEVWRPRLLDRSMWDAWVASGREGAYEKATALAEEVLAGHTVVPLGDELDGTLRRIVAESGL